MRRPSAARPFAILALSALTACGIDGTPADLAIRDVTVIDAVNGVRANRTVVVDAGRIVGVVPSSEGVTASTVSPVSASSFVTAGSSSGRSSISRSR